MTDQRTGWFISNDLQISRNQNKDEFNIKVPKLKAWEDAKCGLK